VLDISFCAIAGAAANTASAIAAAPARSVRANAECFVIVPVSLLGPSGGNPCAGSGKTLASAHVARQPPHDPRPIMVFAPERAAR
jgi:hypothetical protein